MFSYLRYFSIISAVVVTIAAIALGYYFRSSASSDLHDLVTKNNKDRKKKQQTDMYTEEKNAENKKSKDRINKQYANLNNELIHIYKKK